MTPDQRRLLAILRDLPGDRAQTLLEFAEFLQARSAAEEPPAEPVPVVPRPQQESVVKAIKRLAASYPMLDRGKMFSDTSALMTQHVMQGRPASEVIDDLEALFQKHYRGFQQRAAGLPTTPPDSKGLR